MFKLVREIKRYKAQRKAKERNKVVLLSLVSGVGAAVFTFFFTPNDGKKNREKAAQKMVELREGAKEKATDAREKLKPVVQNVKDGVVESHLKVQSGMARFTSDFANRFRGGVDKVADAVEEKAEKAKQATEELKHKADDAADKVAEKAEETKNTAK